MDADQTNRDLIDALREASGLKPPADGGKRVSPTARVHDVARMAEIKDATLYGALDDWTKHPSTCRMLRAVIAQARLGAPDALRLMARESGFALVRVDGGSGRRVDGEVLELAAASMRKGGEMVAKLAEAVHEASDGGAAITRRERPKVEGAAWEVIEAAMQILAYVNPERVERG